MNSRTGCMFTDAGNRRAVLESRALVAGGGAKVIYIKPSRT